MTTPDYAQRDRNAAEDREEAAKRWMRGYAQIRGLLVQNPETGRDRRGTLAVLVSERQHRALLLYLALLSVWPWLQRERLPLEAHAWMHLLHSRSVPGHALVWSESTLSRTWKYLTAKGLVEKHRGRRGLLYVAPRMEDGSGPYTAPTGEKSNLKEAYFTLPDRFWLDEDFAKLTLPGLAMLLVVAKETNKVPEFRITQDQIAEWYGFSRGTVAKGLESLRSLQLLEERTVWIPAKLSKIRTTSATHYSLVDAYSTVERSKARAAAERRRRRAGKAMNTGSSLTFVSSDGDDPDDT